jgi:hypothetical protein
MYTCHFICPEICVGGWIELLICHDKHQLPVLETLEAQAGTLGHGQCYGESWAHCLSLQVQSLDHLIFSSDERKFTALQ